MKPTVLPEGNGFGGTGTKFVFVTVTATVFVVVEVAMLVEVVRNEVVTVANTVVGVSVVLVTL